MKPGGKILRKSTKKKAKQKKGSFKANGPMNIKELRLGYFEKTESTLNLVSVRQKKKIERRFFYSILLIIPNNEVGRMA